MIFHLFRFVVTKVAIWISLLLSLCKKTPNTSLLSFWKRSFTKVNSLIFKTSKASPLTLSYQRLNKCKVFLLALLKFRIYKQVIFFNLKMTFFIELHKSKLFFLKSIVSVNNHHCFIIEWENKNGVKKINLNFSMKSTCFNYICCYLNQLTWKNHLLFLSQYSAPYYFHIQYSLRK